MTASSESKPERTDPSAQKPPTNPTVQEMITWNMEKVRGWIQERDPDLLGGNNLENFTEANIRGRAFLLFSIEDFRACGLPLPVAVVLKDLADEVKEESKFIPRT
jgi:hypothetical protein